MSLRTKQVLAIAVGIIVAIVMLLLGLWQMASFQRSMVDIGAERADMESVVLADSVAPDGTIEDIYGRRTVISGSYLPEHSLMVGTEWPMRAVTLFQLDDGRHVAVVRGLADSPVEAADLPTNTQTEGIFTAGDQAGTDPVADGAPDGSLPTLRLQSLVQEWPQPIIAGYITVGAEEAAAFGLEPAVAVLPEGEGTAMHQGYALQWWVFAGASVAFGIIVARGFKESATKGRSRRKVTSPTA